MGKELKGKLTLLFDSDRGLTIQIEDKNSGLNILNVNVKDAKSVVALLSRLSSVECDIELYSTENAGKVLIIDKMEFKVDDEKYNTRADEAFKEAVKICPKGWKPDNYFNSQNSFFTKGDETYARCTIRKYVDADS
ncbi:MAG: hypothetical protein JRC90_12005, partial [Deltaproteobacteria bacterium]|nr:hypothetical protein [Deltaproteobacteria bacterium]